MSSPQEGMPPSPQHPQNQAPQEPTQPWVLPPAPETYVQSQSSEDIDTAQAVPPATHQESGPADEQQGRLRNGIYSARLALTSMLAETVSRDLRRTTRHESVTLRGSRTETKTVADPLTGRPTEAEDVIVPRRTWGLGMRIPITGHERQDLLRREKDGQTHEVQTGHPLLRPLKESIVKGDFRQAVRIATTLDELLRTTSVHLPSLPSRLANRVVPEGHKRETQLRAAYRDITHSVYDTVMAAEPESGPETEQPPRSWDAELNLRNIQALKAFVIEDCKEKGGEQGLVTAQTHMRVGGLHTVHPHALASYLGVDTKALKDQLQKGGERVVPPIVLTKLYFFLSFAADEMPEGGLAEKLADFNDAPAEDTSPMDRLRDEVTIGDRLIPGEPREVPANQRTIPHITPTPRTQVQPFKITHLTPNIASTGTRSARPTKRTPSTPQSRFEALQQQLKDKQAAPASSTSTPEGGSGGYGVHFEEPRLQSIYASVHARVRQKAQGQTFDKSTAEGKEAWQQLNRDARSEVLDEYAAAHNLPDDMKRGIARELRRIHAERQAQKPAN